MGYLINNPGEIITAKVSWINSDLLKPAFAYDIPEFPAVSGYFWVVLYFNAEIIEDAGATPYTGTSAIHIQAAAAANPQYRFIAAYMAAPVGTWDMGTNTGTGIGTKFAQNSQLQVHNPGTLTDGDTGLNIYIGAKLIKY